MILAAAAMIVLVVGYLTTPARAYTRAYNIVLVLLIATAIFSPAPVRPFALLTLAVVGAAILASARLRSR